MSFLLFVFARIALGTLLREATGGAPLPSAEGVSFCGGSEEKISPARAEAAGRFFLWKPRPEGRRSRSRTPSAAGRGISTERVTEGEQGKYGRDGAFWKHPSEGHLYKGACATRQQWNYNLSRPTDPAAKAASERLLLSDGPHRPPHCAMRRACRGATGWKAGCTATTLGRRGRERDLLLYTVGRFASVSSELAPARSRNPPGVDPITEDRIYRRDALSDPAHDRNRHRVAECLVTGAIGGQLAAILDQSVVVRETLQALTLARGQPAHGHLRSHHAIGP